MGRSKANGRLLVMALSLGLVFVANDFFRRDLPGAASHFNLSMGFFRTTAKVVSVEDGERQIKVGCIKDQARCEMRAEQICQSGFLIDAVDKATTHDWGIRFAGGEVPSFSLTVLCD